MAGFREQAHAGRRLTDLSYVFAYGVSLVMVQVLKQCGSRENIMKQAASLRDFDARVTLPGIRVNTGASIFHPIKAMQLMTCDGRTWVPFGGIIEGV